MAISVSKDSKSKKADKKTEEKPSIRPFIQKDNVSYAYEETKRYLKRYTDPFDEFERLARNRPSPDISPELPKITDGTLAAIVQEQPKRIVQQIPTGLITCKDYPEYADAAQYVLSEKLIPMSNRMGSELQKSWNMIGKAETYGLSASYTFFTQTGSEMHTDWVIPYIKDIFIEKGKVFAPDSNILFMRSWYQKRDIKAIIDREKKFAEKDKNYTSDWDLKLLADLMDNGETGKSENEKTPAEREKGGDAGGIEVIHAFQRGERAEFYSFSPRFEDGKVIRTKINQDPRGNMPIDFMYCNIDLSNPYGRGQVELSGGVQNLIDQQMQMFQFMTTMEMGPPLQVWGTVNKASLKLRPNSIWDMGTNGNNKVDPYAPSNYALQNYTPNAQFLQSKIYALNSSQDHSIGAENGNAGQSKTQAGVQAGEARLGISDNYLRKQYEAWKGDQYETGVNIYFSEMTGKGTVTIPKERIKDVAKTHAAKFLKKDGTLEIPYKEINDVVFRFKVDASSSEVKENSENVEKLTEIYKILQSDPDPNLADKKTKLLKVLIDEIGAEGTDELFPEESEDAAEGMQQQGPDPQMIQQMIMQMLQEIVPEAVKQSVKQAVQEQDQGVKQQQNALKSRELDIKERQMQADTAIKAHDSVSKAMQADDAHDLAESQHNLHTLQALQDPGEEEQIPEDAPLSPEETKVVEALTTQGFNEQDSEQAIIMARQGRPIEEIMQLLRSKHG